jgi:putative colanic acid biosynthesis acetyltransferase WcaF
MPEKDSPAGISLSLYNNENFDRGAPLWKEALWMAAKWLFFLNAWPWPSALRSALLRTFGATIGARVVIRSRVDITFPWRLFVADDVWIGEEVLLLTLDRITIESDVCISQRAFVCTGSHDFRRRTFDLVTKPIIIRRGSWIAAQAFIAPGVEIGECSLITPGSVVNQSIPAGVVARGNPAVIVHSNVSVHSS